MGEESREERLLATGTILKNRYLIEKELGQGGIGVVYLARDKELLSKRVVVKILHKVSLQDEWLKRKFRQEIEALTPYRSPRNSRGIRCRRDR